MAKQIKTVDIFEKVKRDLINGVKAGDWTFEDTAKIDEAIKSLKAPAINGNGNGKHAPRVPE